MNDALQIIAGLGAQPAVTRLSGGGARSPLWHQLFADVFNTRVTTLETHEGSAFGAALLAAVATDQFPNATEAAQIAVREKSAKEPNPKSVDFYRKRYEVYRSLYPALKSIFGTIAAFDS